MGALDDPAPGLETRFSLDPLCLFTAGTDVGAEGELPQDGSHLLVIVDISQEVQVVVEHFREFVAPLLAGRAKAMVVVGSRVEAVRWQLAIQHYIREAFRADEYRILLVANKFQTGFDEPLLCGMYVDRRLAGIQAVQTLSRLNRAFPGKDTTFVLDFVNEAGEILEAFRTYYTTATLTDVADPNLVYNLRAKLDAAGHYDDFEVERVVAVELKPGATQGELVAAIAPVEDRLMKRFRADQDALDAATEQQDGKAAQLARDELKRAAPLPRGSGRLPAALHLPFQIFDYGNTEVEKRAIFYRRLLPLLEFGREREGIDLSKVVLTHHTLKSHGPQPMGLPAQEYPRLTLHRDRHRAGPGEGALTDQDKLVYVNETQRKAAGVRDGQQQADGEFADLKVELVKAIIDALDAHAMNDARPGERTEDVLLNHAQLYESLRERAL